MNLKKAYEVLGMEFGERGSRELIESYTQKKSTCRENAKKQKNIRIAYETIIYQDFDSESTEMLKNKSKFTYKKLCELKRAKKAGIIQSSCFFQLWEVDLGFWNNGTQARSLVGVRIVTDERGKKHYKIS